MESFCRICDGHWPNEDFYIADLGFSKVYLHEDQFLPGWCVLILKHHATELFQLTDSMRNNIMAEVSLLAQVLQHTFQAAKMNYSLLGNVTPHIHWHLTPRLKTDPNPLEPPFSIKHDALFLSSSERDQRIKVIRENLLAAGSPKNSERALLLG